MENVVLFIVLACIFGFCMTWGVGANDLANVLGTSMGSRSLTVKQAIIVAIIFEFAGAYLASGNVANTLRNGIIDLTLLSNEPQLFIYGMLAVLLAGFSWMLTASYFGLPVSITHTIVGAIVGFGAITISFHAVHWDTVGTIALSWIISPLLAGACAFLVFTSIQKIIFAKSHPAKSAMHAIPCYGLLFALIFGSLLVEHILQHFGKHSLRLQFGVTLAFAIIIYIALARFTRSFIKKRKLEVAARRHEFQLLEHMFKPLTMLTACAMVFAHGSNDVANAVGPMAAVVDTALSGSLSPTSNMPPWILGLGCAGVIVGFLMYGRRVIQTVGSNITQLTPSRAFAAIFSAAMTSSIATTTGIPVSVTQILVGAVFGVGFARGLTALNLNVIRNIFMSWVITLPAGATFAVIYFYIFRALAGC
ncbi:inorganic phosphate transporter [Piscirickettsia salmonis]|uniref:inorganic phosphate transporter n=1 Tax=Piscirickettsia salmonis TaxID=1238 RepID=UPI003EBA9D50